MLAKFRSARPRVRRLAGTFGSAPGCSDRSAYRDRTQEERQWPTTKVVLIQAAPVTGAATNLPSPDQVRDRAPAPVAARPSTTPKLAGKATRTTISRRVRNLAQVRATRPAARKAAPTSSTSKPGVKATRTTISHRVRNRARVQVRGSARAPNQPAAPAARSSVRNCGLITMPAV